MDLGRSSHIHITTWGTLSRQKKGQRSKGTEGASIITFSHSFTLMVPAYVRQVVITLHVCDPDRILFLFFEAWRRPPPATTEDNYTNTERVPQEIGVLPYAASYHLQCLCKTDKLLIEEPDKKRAAGVPRAGEAGEDRITSPTEPLTSTH